MISDKQLEANRQNALQSTGPNTIDGVEAVKLNALRHGLRSVQTVVPGEDPDAWEAHRAAVIEDVKPVGALELALVEQVAIKLWRLRRVVRFEADMIGNAQNPRGVGALPREEPRPRIRRTGPSRHPDFRSRLLGGDRILGTARQPRPQSALRTSLNAFFGLGGRLVFELNHRDPPSVDVATCNDSGKSRDRREHSEAKSSWEVEDWCLWCDTESGRALPAWWRSPAW